MCRPERAHCFATSKMISQKASPAPGVFVPKDFSLVSEPSCLFGFAPEDLDGLWHNQVGFGGCLKEGSVKQGKGTRVLTHRGSAVPYPL